jgi:hypothetical protein
MEGDKKTWVFQKEKLLDLDETTVDLTMGLTLPLLPFARSVKRRNSHTESALLAEPTRAELFWKSKKKNKKITGKRRFVQSDSQDCHSELCNVRKFPTAFLFLSFGWWRRKIHSS